MVRKLSVLLGAVLFMLNLSGQDKFEISLRTDKSSGIYAPGETVTYTVGVLKNGKLSSGIKYTCQFLVNGYWQEKQEFVSDGKELKLTKTFTAPAVWYSLKVELLPGQAGVPGKLSKELGAIAPRDIRPAVEEPEDFDAFWQKQREELDQVPIRELARIPVTSEGKYKNKVVCWDVKVQCSGGNPVSGYLCMPVNAAPKSLPAIVTFQGSGVVSAGKELALGSKMIAFCMNAHGIENGQPRSYYQNLKIEGRYPMSNYASYGVWKKDLYYYKGVFLRIMRALDYIKTLPEWDGRTLIVSGVSQGGAMSIVAAALDHQVTFCNAGVPALCDHNAVYADRLPGWPKVVYTPKEQLNNEKKWFMMNMNYFDVAHFAKRVKCDIALSAGLLDYVCSPASVMAAYNSIAPEVNKTIRIVPDGTHGTASIGMETRRDQAIDAALKQKK